MRSIIEETTALKITVLNYGLKRLKMYRRIIHFVVKLNGIKNKYYFEKRFKEHK